MKTGRQSKKNLFIISRNICRSGFSNSIWRRGDNRPFEKLFFQFFDDIRFEDEKDKNEESLKQVDHVAEVGNVQRDVLVPQPIGQETEELEEPVDAHDQEDLDDDRHVVLGGVRIPGIVGSKSQTLSPRLKKFLDGDDEEEEIWNLDQEKRKIEENESRHLFALIEKASSSSEVRLQNTPLVDQRREL